MQRPLFPSAAYYPPLPPSLPCCRPRCIVATTMQEGHGAPMHQRRAAVVPHAATASPALCVALMLSAIAVAASTAVDLQAARLDQEMASLRQDAHQAGDVIMRKFHSRRLAVDDGPQSGVPERRIGRPWDPEHPADGDNETVLVLAHFKEPTDWLYTRQPFDYFIVTKCCHQLGWTPHTLPINRGTEGSSYFKFIVENYDRLPRRMIFLHAHEWAHHSSVSVQTHKCIRGQEVVEDDVCGLCVVAATA